ncbi:MAG: hypothetical protein NZM37_04145 [Sandaracinaceae bacterium]|nr:hypothetical protein [Sandaracinaceae bacterium]MDW8246198.1 DNA polymerase III subunit delta' C-terminal domain-containing protein [Sandaracinaceae bacterium]
MREGEVFGEIVGQERAIRILRRAVEQGKVASAYLFEGPSGVGKQKAAFALAACMTASEQRSPQMQLERIQKGNHPDVLVLGPRAEGNRNLQVSVIREQVIPFVHHAPFESKAAFVIFPDAEISFPPFHPEGANALLKTLEEPPSNLHFVLISSRPERLLSTIRSRCLRVRFSPLSEASILEILKRSGVPEHLHLPLCRLAEGRADRALFWAASTKEGQSRLESMVRLFHQLVTAISDEGQSALLHLAEGLARDGEINETLEALVLFFADLLHFQLGAKGAKAALSAWPEVLEAAKSLSLAQSTEGGLGLLRAIDAIAANANRELVLIEWLLRLRFEDF